MYLNDTNCLLDSKNYSLNVLPQPYKEVSPEITFTLLATIPVTQCDAKSWKPFTYVFPELQPNITITGFS